MEQFTAAHDAAGGDANLRVAAGLCRAMALHARGDAMESAAAKASAAREFAALPRPQDGDIGADCEGWLLCQILRREAEATLPSPR